MDGKNECETSKDTKVVLGSGSGKGLTCPTLSRGETRSLISLFLPYVRRKQNHVFFFSLYEFLPKQSSSSSSSKPTVYIYIYGIGFFGWKGRISIDKLSRCSQRDEKSNGKRAAANFRKLLAADTCRRTRFRRGTRILRTVSPRRERGREEGSNQPDRSSCFRSPLPLPLAFLFFPESATIDTWRRGKRERGAREEGGRRGWRLIFRSLASASSSASGRSQQRVGEGPSIHHLVSSSSFRSRPTLLPFLPRPLIYTPTLLLPPSRGGEFRNREIATERREGRGAPPIRVQLLRFEQQVRMERERERGREGESGRSVGAGQAGSAGSPVAVGCGRPSTFA